MQDNEAYQMALKPEACGGRGAFVNHISNKE